MSDELTPSAQAALDALRAQRGACPGGEALVAYDALAPDAKWTHPIHAHVQICSRCQLVLHHLNEPPERGPQRGSRAGDPERPRVWTVRLLVPVGALVLLVAIFPRLLMNRTPVAEAPSTVRGGDIQPLEPIGPVRAVTRFRWESPVVTPRFRVTVPRGGERFWTSETTTSSVSLPPDVTLQPGADYRWVVEAIDRDGDVIMASPPQMFSIAR